MADKSAKSVANNRRQPSRLQRKAPASIQINPVTDWNVAIPLLSPLVTSPDMKTTSSYNSNSKEEFRRSGGGGVSNVVSEQEQAPVVPKKWQHPAAPFYCEPAPPLFPFICTESS